MNAAIIPVACPNCGALFASRGIQISGNVRNLTLSGNKETCPFCGGWANIADGIFNVADNIISVVTAPNITRQMLVAFSVAVKKAYVEKKPPEDLANEVGKIEPSFGDVVRKSGGDTKLYVVVLLLILAAIRTCNLDMKLDVNNLIEQMKGKPPAVVSAIEPSTK